MVSHILFRAGSKHTNYGDKRMCVVFTNCGFMALPLLDALYGSYGLFLGSAFIAVNMYCCGATAWRSCARTPRGAQKIRMR